MFDSLKISSNLRIQQNDVNKILFAKFYLWFTVKIGIMVYWVNLNILPHSFPQLGAGPSLHKWLAQWNTIPLQSMQSASVAQLVVPCKEILLSQVPDYKSVKNSSVKKLYLSNNASIVQIISLG